MGPGFGGLAIALLLAVAGPVTCAAGADTGADEPDAAIPAEDGNGLPPSEEGQGVDVEAGGEEVAPVLAQDLAERDGGGADPGLKDYAYWKRAASRNEYVEADFDRESDPRRKWAEEGMLEEVLVPKFQWFQDRRQVKITLRIKRLSNITLDVDADWVNFTAAADYQRVITSHHFKQEQQEQSAKRALYNLELPLKYPIIGERTKTMIDQGWYTIILRKAVRGKEWKHLLKEPAKTRYSKHAIKDWKKYGHGKEADDVEFLVEKAKNLDTVIAEGGLTLVQFAPTWSDKAKDWAKEYGGAADELEGKAKLVKGWSSLCVRACV